MTLKIPRTRARTVRDPYGMWVVVKCALGGWSLWRYSNWRGAWIGDPPAKGQFRTQREALAEAKVRAEDAFAWKRLSEELEREGREAIHTWLSRES